MNYKKVTMLVLFPPVFVMIALIPVSLFCLIYSFIYLSPTSLHSILSYVLSAYTLTVWCFKIPSLIRSLSKFKVKNKYILLWRSNARLRVNASLIVSLILNALYAVFQLGLGILHHTFWFCSISGYYFALTLMRFFLVRHSAKHLPGERIKEELVRYRACGIILLFMNLSLSLIIFFMVYWNRTFIHHEITTITMAAYTFTSLTIAIINVVKYKKYNSPVFSASKAISLASACVSMLTLESTMLTTFGAESITLTQKSFLLGATGSVISAFIIGMAIYMISQSNKQLKILKINEGKQNG